MYLASEEVGELLGFKTDVIRRWCRNGLLKTFTVPTPAGRKRYYVRKQDLLAFAVSMKMAHDIIRKIKSLEDKK